VGAAHEKAIEELQAQADNAKEDIRGEMQAAVDKATEELVEIQAALDKAEAEKVELTTAVETLTEEKRRLQVEVDMDGRRISMILNDMMQREEINKKVWKLLLTRLVKS